MTSETDIKRNRGSQPRNESFNLREFTVFLRQNLKFVILSTTAGLLLSVVFLIATKSQYQALIQFEMAQIPDLTRSEGSIIGTPISIASVRLMVEDPNVLVGRLAMPSTYPASTMEACELPESPFRQEAFARSAKASVMRKVANVVELSVQHDSPDQAMKCASAVFEMVRAQQDELAKVQIKRASESLEHLRTMLAMAQKEAASRGRAQTTQQVMYLSTRDEILLLQNQITSLESRIKSYAPTRLISPVYASQKAIFPKRTLTLAIGLFIGLILGTAISVFRQLFR